jgi:hypothetical protein
MKDKNTNENSDSDRSISPRKHHDPTIAVRKSRVIEADENIEIVFKMKKTDIVDVYNLYLATKVQKEDKTFIKYKKYDRAYIQTTECTHFCKDLFRKLNTDYTFIKCKYLANKQKWVPFEHMSETKTSDFLDDVEKIFQADE